MTKLEKTEKPSSGPSVSAKAELRLQIAEAAYYRAERRGFVEGGEMEDWLAAEQEVLAMAAQEQGQGVDQHRQTASSTRGS